MLYQFKEKEILCVPVWYSGKMEVSFEATNVWTDILTLRLAGFMILDKVSRFHEPVFSQ